MAKLFIAIDPGFDSMKVITNEHVFKFPFNVIETDERKMNDYNIREDFLLYKDEVGTTYRVGPYARELMFEQKEKGIDNGVFEDFYTEQRFLSGEFKVALRTAIAMAIKKSNLGPINSDDIYLTIALPHAVRNKYASSVIGAATGKHHFYAKIGKDEETEFKFTIKEGNVFTISQTISAILGETSNDKGEINKEKYFYLSNGPTLILDGGYYTMGIVEMSKGGSVDDDKTESDTHHAMRNINMAVAEEIRRQRPDIQHYNIEYLINQNDGTVKYLNHGHAETLEITKIKAAKQKEVCFDFIKYLNRKYNNMLDINYILITGGTGKCFFEQISKAFDKSGAIDLSHCILSSCELYGKKYDIEYAIAIGAYKGLRGKIH